jgi:hypothetical protein
MWQSTFATGRRASSVISRQRSVQQQSAMTVEPPRVHTAGESVMECAALGRRFCPMRTVAAIAAVLVFSSGCVADLPQIQTTGSVPLSGRATVDLCDAAIRERAAQYDPVSIETSLTEPVRQSADGGQVASLFVEIKYSRAGRIEPHSARIACTVAPDGQVTALKG